LIRTNNTGNILWSKYYSLGKDAQSEFPDILVKQTSDKGFVIAANSYSAGNGRSGWIIKTDSMGNTSCNYSVAILHDSTVVLNSSNANIPGPSATVGVTTYTNVSALLNTFLNCYSVDSTSTDTTTTDTTVTTRIIAQLKVNRKVSVFPNPSNGNFTLRKGDLKLTEIEIYDLCGKKVMDIGSQKMNQPEITIDISSQAKGIYILKTTSEEGIIYHRIVLQ
jgi:hypothetical protein